jgi:hypothetical protein
LTLSPGSVAGAGYLGRVMKAGNVVLVVVRRVLVRGCAIFGISVNEGFILVELCLLYLPTCEAYCGEENTLRGVRGVRSRLFYFVKVLGGQVTCTMCRSRGVLYQES